MGSMLKTTCNILFLKECLSLLWVFHFLKCPHTILLPFKCTSKYAKKNLRGFKANKLHLATTCIEHVYEM